MDPRIKEAESLLDDALVNIAHLTTSLADRKVTFEQATKQANFITSQVAEIRAILLRPSPVIGYRSAVARYSWQ